MKTQHKINLAKIIFKIMTIFGIQIDQNVKRGNINWKLKINEGIDLSIFIFGKFEKELNIMIDNLSYKKISYIIDIGSNIGAHTLQFAEKYKNSKIMSFEPTDFAFKKLKKNVEANPRLKNRINIFQNFVGKNLVPEKIYSSWSLTSNESKHKLHKGILKKAENAKIISLDEFVNQYNISGDTIIKCDVDGHELEVFKSGEKFLRNFKPHIIMELAPYLYDEYNYGYKDLINFFVNLNYEFYDGKNLNLINDIYNYSENIKFGSSKNIFLR